MAVAALVVVAVVLLQVVVAGVVGGADGGWRVCGYALHAVNNQLHVDVVVGGGPGADADGSDIRYV